MFKKITLAAAAVSALAIVPASAEARPRYDGYSNYGYAQPYGTRYARNGVAYDQYGRPVSYARNGYDQYGRPISNGYYGSSTSRNAYDQYDRRCKSGTTGAIIGAVAGGLLGREVVGRYGDRTAGAIVGGAAGALAGRAITRNKC